MKPKAGTTLAFTATEAVADSLQSLAIESLHPDPRAGKLAASYARGALSLQAFSAAMDRLDDRMRSEP